MKPSIEPTRVSDSTASSAADATSTVIAAPAVQAGPACPSGSPWPPRVRLGFVNENASDVQASPRMPVAETTNRTVSSTDTTKRNAIVTKLTASVPSRKIRAAGDNGPRMGRPPVRAEAVTGAS